MDSGSAPAVWLQPASAFGQLLAAAVDPALVAALRTVLRDDVLRAFAGRYGLTLAG